MPYSLLFLTNLIGGAFLKRIWIIVLTLVLLLGICPMSALADTGGSGNVDGGGGGMGQGTSQNAWTPGMDGVRITVVDAKSGKPR